VNRLTAAVLHADYDSVDLARLRTLPRSPRTWIGLGLSLSALGLALASALSGYAKACPSAEGISTLDLTPLILFALATAALVADIGPVRRGSPDALWGRIALAAVSIAAALGIWAGAAGIFSAGCG